MTVEMGVPTVETYAFADDRLDSPTYVEKEFVLGGRLSAVYSNNDREYIWFGYNACNCPGSLFLVDDIPLLSAFMQETPAVTHTPYIRDTIGEAYPQDCGTFTVSLEPNTVSGPTLTVADFLTVTNPATGALSL